MDKMEAEERQRILEWFSPINYWLKQNDYFDRAEPDSGQWFLDDSEFQSWIHGETPILWCPGDRTAPEMAVC